VVASELTAARGKASRTVGTGALLAATLLLAPAGHAAAEESTDERDDVLTLAHSNALIMQALGLVPVQAASSAALRAIGVNSVHTQVAIVSDPIYRDSTISGDHLLVLGSRSTLSGSKSVAYGNLITSSGDHNTAVGYNVQITGGGYATGVGSQAVAHGIGATAFGNHAKAYSENSIAVGSGARTVDSSAGYSRIAIGGDAYAGSSGYTGAIALGGEANASHDSVAIGYQARTTSNQSVALGRGAIADESYTVSVGTAGSQGTKRRIVNVKEGRLESGGTDAVTGGQLFATNTEVSKVKTAAASAQTTANTANTTANSALGKANALGGLISQVSAAGNVRVGGENTGTVLDVRNKSGASRRITGLSDGVLSATSTEAVTGKQLNATNANVTTARNAANAAQTTATAAKTTADSALGKANALGGLISQVSATGNVRVGGDNTGTVLDVANKSGATRRITGLGDGTLSATSTEAVTGKQLNATNVGVTTAQNAANAAQSTATAAKTTADSALGKANALGGLISQVSATGNVRVGGDNTGTVLDVANKSGASRRITGLGDGTLSATSTEAVTGKQLNATNANVTTAKNAANTAQTTADSAVSKANALGGLVSQVSATGNVRVGGENTGTVLDVANKNGTKRRISNVANGDISGSSTDVVTGQQLHATNQSVATQGQSLVLQGQQLGTHTQLIGAQDVRISANRTDIDKLRADVDNFDPDLDGVVKFASDGSVDMEGGAIRNVAAGDISSAASTDAVNGGQLFSSNLRIGKLEETNRLVSISRDEYSEAAESGQFAVAIGDGAKASLGEEGGTAVGSFTSAFGKNSVALGRGANVNVSAENGFALGVGANVYAKDGMAFGPYSRVEASAASSVAIGSSSIADELNTVSFGSKSFDRRLVNVGRGTSDHNATNVGQLKDSLATLGGGAGMDGSGNVVAPTYAIQGSSHHTVGDALAALDGAVITSDSRIEHVEDKLRTVFQDNSTLRTDGLNQITLAGANGAVLTNLADGRIAAGSRDAVTGSQLYAAKQDIARNRNDIEQMKGAGGAPASQSRMVVLDSERGPIDFAGSRLTGVHAGDITSSSSTDAVNGGQLYSTNRQLAEVERNLGYLAVGQTGFGGKAQAGEFGLAIGDGAEASIASEGGTAVGAFAAARGKNSVALGRAAYVSEGVEDGFAVGGRTRVEARGGIALGAESEVHQGASNGLALGYQSVAKDSDTASFGNDLLKRRLVNLANGRNANDAATIGQLRGTLSALGGSIDSNGDVIAPTFKVQGHSQATVGEALSALDGAVVTTGSRMDRVEGQLRSVFQDAPSARADGLNQLTFAGANGMVLSNVGNGVVAAGSRDAVNGGQLHSLQQQLNGRMDGLEQRIDGQPQMPESRAMSVAAADEPAAPTPPASDSNALADAGNTPKSSPQPKADAPQPEAPTPQVDTAELEKMLVRANEYSDGISREVDRRLDKMDKRFNRMAAMGSAQSAMAMNTAGLNTYNRLGAGVGYSEGESAMAVGYQRVLNDKGSATFSLNGAFTNSGERTVGVGVGIGW